MNSKIANASFVIFTSVDDFLQELTDEQAGLLFKAIVKYAKDGEIIETSGVVKFAFIHIKQQIDYNKDKYEEVKKKRAEAGKKGAEKRWQDSKIANANFVNSKNSKYSLIDNVIDNVNDIEIDNDIVIDNVIDKKKRKADADIKAKIKAQSRKEYL